MKIRLLILLMMSALAITACKKELVDTSKNNFEDVNSNQTFEEIIASGVTLAFFHASWCHNCEEQRPAIEEADEDAELDFVKFIEIEYEENKEITDANNVPGFPTQIIFKDGEEKERLTGKGHSAAKIKAALLKYE